MSIRTCKKCGFILGSKPGLKEFDGVCLACINNEKKKNIDFLSRQKWLTKYIAENKTHKKYDCVVGVSGGKDSHAIVYRLMHNHNVRNPLLVTVLDEFSITKAGKHNRENLGDFFGVDHLIFRFNPNEFKEKTRNDFETSLCPLRWIEEKIYETPVKIAKNFGIKLVFMGENSAFEYGSSEECSIFDDCYSDDEVKLIFMGSIYPYSTFDSLKIARKCGFINLNYYNEWGRSGNIENDTQIDSMGYIVHLWCKFVKFGYQRVSDIACRWVREGILNIDQAKLLIKENDYKLDTNAKIDFCRTIGITKEYFDQIVEKHANKELVYKDINGTWKRIEECSNLA